MSIKSFAIGLIAVVLGVEALLEYFYSIKIFDWARFKVMKSILLIAIGSYLIFRSLKSND